LVVAEVLVVVEGSVSGGVKLVEFLASEKFV